MKAVWIVVALMQGVVVNNPAQQANSPPPSPVALTINSIAASGRCVTIAEPLSERVTPQAIVAPGPPPVLSFRYFEGRMRHRYGDIDLVLDDAGH